MEIRTYQKEDETEVIQLWQACDLIMPHNDPVKDIRRKLAVQPELFLVGIHDGKIVASVMAGYEGHRGWLNYLAVTPHMRRKGVGKKLVAEVENRLSDLGCPKINVQVRTSKKEATSFYRKLGFLEEQVMSLGKRLESD